MLKEVGIVLVGAFIGFIGARIWRKWCSYVDDLPTWEDILEDNYEDLDD